MRSEFRAAQASRYGGHDSTGRCYNRGAVRPIRIRDASLNEVLRQIDTMASLVSSSKSGELAPEQHRAGDCRPKRTKFGSFRDRKDKDRILCVADRGTSSLSSADDCRLRKVARN